MTIWKFNSYNFGHDLKLLREERRLTQTQLAKRAKLNINSVQNYESGYRLPKLEILIDIARVLGVDEIRIDTRKGGGRYGA